jgi:signal peptidase I
MDERLRPDLPTTPEALHALQPVTPTPPAPVRPPAAAAGEPGTVKGIKETIESILIAFILAFVFRAFVVEAFVIPTGSMAPTLLGAHMRFACKECGYQWDVGYSAQHEGADINIEERAGRPYVVYCPNCKWKVPRDDSLNPYVRYGDRILVLKYLYIPWISHPQRWDVVVFKSPEPVPPAPDYVTNYIKRLIGLPGEWVMLLDGDIYVCNDKDYESVEFGQSIPPHKWKIQRKPRHAQEALWRVIYDHDFRPVLADSKDGQRRSDGWRLPWVYEPGSGWDTGDRAAKIFTFNNPAGGGTLRFEPRADPYHLPPNSAERSGEPQSLYYSDWLAYDVAQYDFDVPRDPDQWKRHTPRTYRLYTVSDLKLAFSYVRTAGDGPLRARLTKGNDVFFAEFDRDKVRLIHRRPDGAERTYGEQPLRATSPASPLRVEFENVDHRVTLRLDGKDVFQTNDDQYAPNVKALLDRYFDRSERAQFEPPAVSIEAARQQAQLSHVSLWRDVYYTPHGYRAESLHQGSPEKPIKLGQGLDANEYFVLGDNSAASADSRLWTHPVNLENEGGLQVLEGRVPGRFMLGKAFFVYWPAGYRPLTNQAPAVVPNFGEMRFIN